MRTIRQLTPPVGERSRSVFATKVRKAFKLIKILVREPHIIKEVASKSLKAWREFYPPYANKQVDMLLTPFGLERIKYEGAIMQQGGRELHDSQNTAATLVHDEYVIEQGKNFIDAAKKMVSNVKARLRTHFVVTNTLAHVVLGALSVGVLGANTYQILTMNAPMTPDLALFIIVQLGLTAILGAYFAYAGVKGARVMKEWIPLFSEVERVAKNQPDKLAFDTAQKIRENA